MNKNFCLAAAQCLQMYFFFLKLLGYQWRADALDRIVLLGNAPATAPFASISDQKGQSPQGDQRKIRKDGRVDVAGASTNEPTSETLLKQRETNILTHNDKLKQSNLLGKPGFQI